MRSSVRKRWRASPAAGCSETSAASKRIRVSETPTVNTSDCTKRSALISTNPAKPIATRASRACSVSSSFSASSPQPSALPGSRPNSVP